MDLMNGVISAHHVYHRADVCKNTVDEINPSRLKRKQLTPGPDSGDIHKCAVLAFEGCAMIIIGASTEDQTINISVIREK